MIRSLSFIQEGAGGEIKARPEVFKACTIDGCNGNAHHLAKGARGWCSAHYTRWHRHGHPLAGRTTLGEPLAFLEQALITVTDDCVIWPFAATLQGRGRVWIDGRSHMASRIVCQRTHGAPPTPQHEAAHSCGKGHEGCINPRHLRWATPKENHADKLIHGTHNRGERCSTAKLTQADVRAIRRRSDEGETQTSLANEFGVNFGTISKIVLRKRWGWLTS